MKICIDLPDDVFVRLEAIAAAVGHPKEDVVLGSLQRYLTAHSTSSLAHPHAQHPPICRKKKTGVVRTTAPICELVNGLLYGDTTVGSVLKSGTFGLGTLNYLDGELVVLDGVAYQQTADGKSNPVQTDAKTPWMMVTDFDEDEAEKIELPNRLDHAALCDTLLQATKKNSFVAIKVVGEFEVLNLRAVRKQSGNRPLIEVSHEQALFNFGPGEIGSLVGFWSPEYVGYGLNVPGFHLHYISEDLKRGGHVLNAVLTRGVAYLQPIYHLLQDIPASEEFQKAELMARDTVAELKSSEGNHHNN